MSSTGSTWAKRRPFEEYVAALGMLLMLLLVCLQIVQRAVFNTSFLWSEEVSRYLMVWSVYFGAAGAVASRGHLRIEMLLHRAPSTVRRVLDIVADIWVFLFSVALTWAGYLYVREGFALGMVSGDSDLPITLGWIHLVIPVTFALSAIHSLRLALRLVRASAPGQPGS